ncbi:MAG: membrane protein insertase YidC [Bdellovibrionales bacterium]|nr:membrane protein insertase YidC [Bdellovibrionales bacterium]
MDRRTWVAILLCAGIFVAWQQVVLKKYKPHQSGATPAQQEISQKSLAVGKNQDWSSATGKAEVPPIVKPIVLKNGTLSIGNDSSAIHSWIYQPDPASPKKDLEVSMNSLIGTLPQIEFTLSEPFFQVRDMRGELKEISSGEYEWSAEDQEIKIRRRTKVNSNLGYVDVTYSAEFKSTLPKHAFISMLYDQAGRPEDAHDRHLVYFAGDKHQSLVPSKVKELTEVRGPVKWIGLENRYFIFSAVDLAGTASALLQPAVSQPSARNRIGLVYPVSSNRVEIPVRVFFGPKSIDVLKAVHPSLDHAVSFGLLSPLAYAILHFMKWLFSFFGNYGIAIILLTVVLKILLYPLTYKGAKSMKKMSALQPQMQKIREKFKDNKNKEAMNREIMALMKTSGANPIGGCLPMLLQMPIFFALYQVLYSSFELYRSPFALWIHDLSQKDPFFVTPILLTAVMYLQSKLTPATGMDPAQRKMMQAMPVIFGVFMLTLPSGLTLYMLTNAIVSIIQQLMINKKLGINPSPAVSFSS